ncbi:MAG TPA: sigma-54 dependent transcriptional regulator [Polyangiales bacterium]
MNEHIRVLIADDDAKGSQALSQSLIRHGYFCELARTADAALGMLARSPCDLVICDASIGSGQRFDVLDRLKLAMPTMPVIVLTAAGSISDAVEAIRRGAFQYLTKPCPIDELHRHIHLALAGSDRVKPFAWATARSGEIVQESGYMKALMESVARVALSSAPVLIVGDTGTGKERVARAIHAAGARRAHPFIAINTTAIPEQLLESELFGHVRGAFTGATQARSGLFIEAQGGTLLLDEIGDMPRSLQPKLLRALQFGEIRPVGSDRTRQMDVRIVAATHRDLDLLVKEGLFRDDLRYRLNTVVLRIPPLCDRREDIAPLTRQFLESARTRTPVSPVVSFGSDAMQLLEAAPWPGNIRELESAVERCVIFGRESVVSAHDLAFLQPGPSATAERWPTTNGQHFTLRQMNQRYLDWVLEQTAGDKARAAEVLGIDLSTLYRWQRAKN